MQSEWLRWARELQAMAQNGLTYTQDLYDQQRYTAIRRIAAEMLARETMSDATTIHQLFNGESGHATPKVDVRGALFREQEILLVRERDEGLWTTPGGWADVGEPPSIATVREVQEEAGYAVRVTKLAMLYDRDRHGHPPHPFHIYKLFFLCELVDGTLAPSSEIDGAEIDDVGFFALDQLPPLSLSRITAAQIERLFVHHQYPELPTDFD
jgi:ADP-ribose pyrophosphatase YjhB (NUDIX family)